MPARIENESRDRLLTAKEAAERLRVHLSTVYLWAQQGYLPHLCLSETERRRCIRFSERALEEWLRERGRAGRLDRLPDRHASCSSSGRQRGVPGRN